MEQKKNEDKSDKTEIAQVSCLLEEIFIRLPIPDLNECRLVCQEWYESIRNRSFVEKVKSQHGTNAKLCLHDRSSAGDVVTVKFDDEKNLSIETYVGPLLLLDSPSILASVHDQILIGDEQQKTLLILNPSTRTCRRIEDESRYGWWKLYGLAYNKAEADYTIVRVLQVIPEDEYKQKTYASIFSLQRHKWTTKRLRKFKLWLSQYVGCLHERLYFCDSDSASLVTFNLSMEDVRLIPLQLELMGHVLTFGVAREKVIPEQVREVLLICCHNRKDEISSLWRLRKEKDGDIFENLAVWGNEWLLQPLSYLLGDPDMILLLQDRRAIQVYNVVQQSRTEIYNDGTEEGERGEIAAIGFYDTSVSAPLQEEIVTIQTSGTKKRKKYHPVGSPEKLHKKDAVEKLKKD